MWGKSPPLNLLNEIVKLSDDSNESLEVLIIGGRDARHILKTLSSLYINPKRNINFHSFEHTLEHIARSILLLHISFQNNLGLQEASRYFLEILGNTLLTPATAKYLIKTADQLINVVTKTIECPWLDLDSIKYKDRDFIEAIFKFWVRAGCEGIPIVEYWDRRVRKALGARYDYRDGVFDWDFHMVLKTRNVPYLTLQEYKFWRNNGVAFTWLETEPCRSNPTLISGIIPHGSGFVHYSYMGDITDGPHLTWSIDEPEDSPKMRASDKAENQIIKVIYQMQKQEVCPQECVAAHRNTSLITGTIVCEMPSSDIEQETWKITKNRSNKSNDHCSWINNDNFKIYFHTISNLKKYKNKKEWLEKIDIVFLSYNSIDNIEDIIPLIKRNALIIVELKTFIVNVRKDDQEKFCKELIDIMTKFGLQKVEPLNCQDDIFYRFINVGKK